MNYKFQSHIDYNKAGAAKILEMLNWCKTNAKAKFGFDESLPTYFDFETDEDRLRFSEKFIDYIVVEAEIGD